jgi:hypothetical protein
MNLQFSEKKSLIRCVTQTLITQQVINNERRENEVPMHMWVCDTAHDHFAVAPALHVICFFDMFDRYPGLFDCTKTLPMLCAYHSLGFHSKGWKIINVIKDNIWTNVSREQGRSHIVIIQLAREPLGTKTKCWLVPLDVPKIGYAHRYSK